MRGYGGRYLRVNLSAGTVVDEPLPPEVARDFIAGRGFGIKYLYDELAPNIDPLGEQNKLLFVPGVLAGTQAQSVSRWVACTKSPLTGCIARSCSGGDFGAWMKFAGYDFILIEGISDKPVYLYISPEGARLEDAAGLWGRDTAYTQDWLIREYGKDVRTACIGPAEVMDAWPDSTGEAKHTSTFLGNPLACAAAIASLAEIERHALAARAGQEGARLLERLQVLSDRHACIGEVRGRGLMVGLDLVRDPGTREPDPELARRLVTGALRRGWLLLAGGPEGNVISLSPPLTISRALLDSSIRMLDDLLLEAAASPSSPAA